MLLLSNFSLIEVGIRMGLNTIVLDYAYQYPRYCHKTSTLAFGIPNVIE